jgi:hypothetical protein
LPDCERRHYRGQLWVRVEPVQPGGGHRAVQPGARGMAIVIIMIVMIMIVMIMIVVIVIVVIMIVVIMIVVIMIVMIMIVVIMIVMIMIVVMCFRIDVLSIMIMSADTIVRMTFIMAAVAVFITDAVTSTSRCISSVH